MNLRNTRARGLRRGLTALAGAAILVLGACDSGSEPAGPDLANEPVPRPEVRNASFVADVDLKSGEIRITAPEDGVNTALIADYFGLQPGHPELSILGGDVIDVEPDAGTLTFGPPQPSGAVQRRNVSYEITVRNRLQGAALIGTTNFPIPPTGVSSPVIFPFENVVTTTTGTVTQGGETNDIIVETPNEGDVLTTDTADWVGPHNFFNDDGCPLGANLDGLQSDSDCYLYQPVLAAGTGADRIDGLGSSEPIRVSFDPEVTVNQFRTRFIVAANLEDAVPNVDPTASFTFGSCEVGTPVDFDGSASSDSDGFLENYAWTWDDGSSDSGAGLATTQHTYTAAGTYDVTLEVQDNRGGTDALTQQVTCTEPPPNASVSKVLQDPSGNPVSQVVEGQSYRYVITVANNGTISTVTGLVLEDLLDSDIDPASVSVSVVGGTNPTFDLTGSTVTVPASGTMDIAPSSDVVITIDFTLLTGIVGGGNTLDNSADLIATGNDSDASDDSAQVDDIPVVGQPNLLVRWVAQDNTPITSANVGETVRLQVCALDGRLENFEAQLDFDVSGEGQLTYSTAVDLDSDGEGLTGPNTLQPHPDCAGISGQPNFDSSLGTEDLLDDQFQQNAIGGGLVNFLNQRTELTAESVEPVGILDVFFVADAAGTVDASDLNFDITIFDGTGGVAITPVIDLAPLTIN